MFQIRKYREIFAIVSNKEIQGDICSNLECFFIFEIILISLAIKILSNFNPLCIFKFRFAHLKVIFVRGTEQQQSSLGDLMKYIADNVPSMSSPLGNRLCMKEPLFSNSNISAMLR